jgi:hypothetical protein
MKISFVTTTSYGTWLPGELRGYVRKGELVPGDLKLLEMSRRHHTGVPVYFNVQERLQLFAALKAACDEFDYRLSDVAIESWHLHWILFHRDDEIEVVVGRLKNRMRQSLNRGRIWTKGFCAVPLFDNLAIEQAQEYVAKHRGCMMSDGRAIRGVNPRRSRGLPAKEN